MTTQRHGRQVTLESHVELFRSNMEALKKLVATAELAQLTGGRMLSEWRREFAPRLFFACSVYPNRPSLWEAAKFVMEQQGEYSFRYYPLIREARPPEKPTKPGKPMVLPEILLRNAQVDYSEIRGGQYYELGSLAVEGQLTPSVDGQRYGFELHSHRHELYGLCSRCRRRTRRTGVGATGGPRDRQPLRTCQRAPGPVLAPLPPGVYNVLRSKAAFGRLEREYKRSLGQCRSRPSRLRKRRLQIRPPR